MITAYLDESGIDAESGSVWLAGYAAENSEWLEFDRQWRWHMAEYGVSSLHMKDFGAQRGEFSGWSKEKRDSFLSEAVSIVNSRDLFGFSAGVLNRDYEKFREKHAADKALQRRYGRQLKSPYYLVLQLAFIDILAFFPEEEVKGRVALVLEEQREFQGFAGQLVEGLRESADWSRGRYLGSVVFAPKSEAPRLQTADLLAYEMRREMQQRQLAEKGEQRRPERISLTRLRKRLVNSPYLDSGVLDVISRDLEDEKQPPEANTARRKPRLAAPSLD